MPRKKSANKTAAACDCAPSTGARLAEIGVMLVVLIAVYQIGKHLELFSFATNTEEVVSLTTVFLIGLTASATSCLAMVGGLLLSISAKWAESHPDATGWSKFRPQVGFNIGRIIGYFVFGGLVGLLGQGILLSVQTSGIVKVLLSVVMIILGLNILGLIPKRFCRMPLPSGLQKRIRGLSKSDSTLAPLTLGALTFFIPCGFTQSMQVLALGSGSFLSGAMIMSIFSLGTLPSLLGIGAVSSFVQGKSGRVFLTFAGCLSLLLGFTGVRSGLLLTGIDLSLPEFTTQASITIDPNVIIDRNGQQVISVTVSDGGYSTESFTIEADTPTWIYATAPNHLSGCLSNMTIPAFSVSQPLKKGENWIGPIRPTRDFAFMCSMGMFKADVHVRS